MININDLVTDNSIPREHRKLYLYFIKLFNKQNSEVWNKKIKSTTVDYHVKVILNNGKCNFYNPPYNLTSIELKILYNYYFFPFYFKSSYDIYCKILSDKDEFKNNFIFHDFLCNTLANTLAFACALSSLHKKNENLIGFNHPDFFIETLYLYQSKENLKYLNQLFKILNLKYLNSNKIDSSDFKLSDYFIKNESVDSFILPLNFENPTKIYSKIINQRSNKINVVINYSLLDNNDCFENDILKTLINDYIKTGANVYVVFQNLDTNENWELLKSNLYHIYNSEGVIQILKEDKKQKIKYEVVKTTSLDKLYKIFIVYFQKNNFVKLEELLLNYFQSPNFHIDIFNVKIDFLNKKGHFNFCNYITDFAFAHNFMSKQAYFHKKAHLYRDINSLVVAKSFYEKDVEERNGEISHCYKSFLKNHFPKSN